MSDDTTTPPERIEGRHPETDQGLPQDTAADSAHEAAATPRAPFPGFLDPDDWQAPPLRPLDTDGNEPEPDPAEIEHARATVERVSSEHDSEHGLRDHPWCEHCEVPIREARYGPCDWDARPATGWSADVQTMLAQLDPTLEDFMPRTPRESLQSELVDRARHYLTYSAEPGCDYDPEVDSPKLAAADQQAADERALRLYKP